MNAHTSSVVVSPHNSSDEGDDTAAIPLPPSCQVRRRRQRLSRGVFLESGTPAFVPEREERPLSSYPCKLGKTLRYFIAEDAIGLASKDPSMYRSLIGEVPLDPVGSLAPKDTPDTAVKPPSITSRTESSKISPRSVFSNESHRISRCPDSYRRDLTSVGLKKDISSIPPPASQLPPDRLVYSHWRYGVVPICCIVHTMRNFSTMHHTSMAWGGLMVLLPYTFVSVFFTYPIVLLELTMGNIVRGGLAKAIGAVAPAFQGASVLAWFGAAWFTARQTFACSKTFWMITQMFSPQPGWIPSTRVRLDCEQTDPAASSCIQKEGCVYLSGVCTVDATYWAKKFNATLNFPEKGSIVMVVASLWFLTGICQCNRCRPTLGLIGCLSLLGVIILFYLTYQETSLIAGQEGTLTTIPSLYQTRRPDYSFSLQSLFSSGMWLDVAMASFTSAGIGRGWLFGGASFLPYGANVTKLTLVLLGVDVVGTITVVVLGNYLLKLIAYRTGKDEIELMSSLPHFVAVLIPSMVQNVVHKKFVAQLVILCQMLSEFASVTMGTFMLVEAIHESHWMRAHRTPRMASAVLVAVSLLLLMILRRLLAVGDMTQAVEYVVMWLTAFVVFIECVVFGWLCYSPHQVKAIGPIPTYGLVLTFICGILFGTTTGISSLLTLSSAQMAANIPTWVYRQAPMVLGILVFIVLSALVISLLVRVGHTRYTRGSQIDDRLFLNDRTLSRCVSEGDTPLPHTPYNDRRPVLESSDTSRTTELSHTEWKLPALPKLPARGGVRFDHTDSHVPNSVSSLLITDHKGLSSTRASESVGRQPFVTPKVKRQAKFSTDLPQVISASSANQRSHHTTDASSFEMIDRPWKSALWWMFLGNIELLRYDLNRLMTGSSLSRIHLHWSLAVKFLVPVLCVLVLTHLQADILLSMSGNMVLMRRERVVSWVPHHISLWGVDLFGGFWLLIAISLGVMVLLGIIAHFHPQLLSIVSPPKRSHPLLNNSLRAYKPQKIWMDYKNVEHFMFLELLQFEPPGVSENEQLQSTTDLDYSAMEFLPSRIYKKITTAVFERMTHQSLADIEATADKLIQTRGFAETNRMETQSGPLG
eukprot:Blabericola_migrator_1__936@NODE_1233_length_5026_cov_59_119984_g835_i0_p1_GENE_NODE_1233_length_5026_cov_59_119984_g835_i0NODE_1233_length_5026_cov_59_119984_g835_i0_p1_ORF_typecomplete_len1097_score172_26SNF/PF00209_18/1_4e06SNF/PF00209_18/5_5e02SNF/PF00209_18/34Baculo_11_kDa/PF06143_11/13Baculo_11_kDa/PF06143_11/39_NODE_1233_length_5026_cov_59_119984_g835_i016844974